MHVKVDELVYAISYDGISNLVMSPLIYIVSIITNLQLTQPTSKRISSVHTFLIIPITAHQNILSAVGDVCRS